MIIQDKKNVKILLLLLGFLIVLGGCSRKKVLSSTEEYLLDHLGNIKSYKRIEWGITDTIFLNDLKLKEVLDSIPKLRKRVSDLELEYEDIKAAVEDHEVMISKCVDGQYIVQGGPFHIRQEGWSYLVPLKTTFGNNDLSTIRETTIVSESSLKISLSLREEILGDYESALNQAQRNLIILEKMPDSLTRTRRKSPIETLSLYIRFRAILYKEPIRTYKATFNYDFDEREPKMLGFEADGF